MFKFLIAEKLGRCHQEPLCVSSSHLEEMLWSAKVSKKCFVVGFGLCFRVIILFPLLSCRRRHVAREQGIPTGCRKTISSPGWVGSGWKSILESWEVKHSALRRVSPSVAGYCHWQNQDGGQENLEAKTGEAWNWARGKERCKTSLHNVALLQDSSLACMKIPTIRIPSAKSVFKLHSANLWFWGETIGK